MLVLIYPKKLWSELSTSSTLAHIAGGKQIILGGSQKKFLKIRCLIGMCGFVASFMVVTFYLLLQNPEQIEATNGYISRQKSAGLPCLIFIYTLKHDVKYPAKPCLKNREMTYIIAIYAEELTRKKPKTVKDRGVSGITILLYIYFTSKDINNIPSVIISLRGTSSYLYLSLVLAHMTLFFNKEFGKKGISP
ncbi:hypothetical protein BDA99DRAFT_570858 [Phascolomyces articulosus]|uniref:Uncharacterized protein n=1 Tax=Phascolomyces articulosus TaxID=60185 RepID=A0AAD5KC45_9FUNG|nr:hypothetical protein BDA99DRAFT_570858 [Phascolomyces articulosus]